MTSAWLERREKHGYWMACFALAPILLTCSRNLHIITSMVNCSGQTPQISCGLGLLLWGGGGGSPVVDSWVFVYLVTQLLIQQVSLHLASKFSLALTCRNRLSCLAEGRMSHNCASLSLDIVWKLWMLTTAVRGWREGAGGIYCIV